MVSPLRYCKKFRDRTKVSDRQQCQSVAREGKVVRSTMAEASCVTQITTTDQFNEFVSANSDKLSVLFFWADFHEASQAGGQLDVLYAKLAAVHKDCAFAKVCSTKQLGICCIEIAKLGCCGRSR